MLAGIARSPACRWPVTTRPMDGFGSLSEQSRGRSPVICAERFPASIIVAHRVARRAVRSVMAGAWAAPRDIISRVHHGMPAVIHGQDVPFPVHSGRPGPDSDAATARRRKASAATRAAGSTPDRRGRIGRQDERNRRRRSSSPTYHQTTSLCHADHEAASAHCRWGRRMFTEQRRSPIARGRAGMTGGVGPMLSPRQHHRPGCGQLVAERRRTRCRVGTIVPVIPPQSLDERLVPRHNRLRLCVVHRAGSHCVDWR